MWKITLFGTMALLTGGLIIGLIGRKWRIGFSNLALLGLLWGYLTVHFIIRYWEGPYWKL